MDYLKEKPSRSSYEMTVSGSGMDIDSKDASLIHISTVPSEMSGPREYTIPLRFEEASMYKITYKPESGDS
jgi:hypothetical protein